MARIASGTPTVTLEVPVNDLGDHMVTAVEQGYEWFQWDNVVQDEKGRITQATLEYPNNGDEDDVVERTFTDLDFVQGLRKFVAKYGLTTEVTYQGDGDWDIDAAGADAIVQEFLYGEQIFS